MAFQLSTCDMVGCKEETTTVRNDRYRVDEKNYNKAFALVSELEPLILHKTSGKVWVTRGGVVIEEWDTFKYVRKGNKKRGRFTGKYMWEDLIWQDLGLTSFLTEAFGDIVEVNFQKHKNNIFSKFLGCAPVKFIEMFNACMFKAFVPDDLKWCVKKYGSGSRGKLHPPTVTNLYQRQSMIRQAIKDGQNSIVPLILRTKDESFGGVVSIKNLRKYVGKSGWKKLLNNSETRNNKIGYYTSSERKGNKLKEVMHLPSTLLCSKLTNQRSDEYFKPEIIEALKTNKLLTKDHRHFVRILSDTLDMYRTLGLTIPKQHKHWTIGKWKEKHDELVKKINIQKYSPEKFKWMKPLKREFVYKEDSSLTAVLLDNMLDIKTEGESMHHCVGVYGNRVARKSYLVLSIQKEGKRSSTLGLHLDKDKRLTFNQHYGTCNSSVTDENEKEFAQQLINQINKELKEKKICLD